MSTQDESGVYYTPSLGFSNHHPDSQDVQQHPRCSQDALKQCSVKGCTETLTSDDTNKMCDGCRSRHRVYANTKRARRKLEKAAIATAVAARNGKNTEMSLIDHGPQPITWVNAGAQSRQDLLRPSASSSTIALSSLSTWNHAIDPRLFSGDVSPASPHHLPSLMPHQTSTSSELANALTPRNPSTPVTVPTSILPNQAATDHNKHYHDLSAPQKQSSHLQIPSTPVANREDDDDSNDNDEEQRVIESLQVTPVQDQQVGVSLSDRQASSETAELSQGRSSDEVDGSARSCSVKGCKAVIPASYEYKMCPTCRTRYRTYGNTKRAKWKAERDAFDREMATLRAVEDEKRKAKGLRPLAESPEELRAWELSIIDEQVPAVPADNSSALPETSPVVEPSTQSLSLSPTLIAGMNSPMVVYPPNISSSSTADAISQYQLNNNPILAAAANTSLPSRMCTVSHCHKILPGYYRYKRCEQHRLQNRHHSQLKRVREREIKGVGSEKGTALAEIPHEMEADKDKDKLDKETKQATVALTTAGIEGKESKDAGSFSSTTGGGDSESQKKSHDQKRSKFSCSAGDCHNLLLPTVRWRLCESCRSRDRQRKNQIKFQQKAAAGKEKMNADSQVGVVSENAVGEAEESQEINHAISAGAIDPDAEGDIDMGENDETEPRAVEIQQSFVSPPLPSMPPASMTGGFSRFHVTIDPRNAPSSATLDPKTSTAQLVTLDDPLAFRAYRPKTTPSAIGRILARNPGLSVDAFTEVLQAESASTGVMTLSQANATSTTKSIITPTIPTSAPFVYKAPEKKITPLRGTVAKGKRKETSSEKQSASSSTTPATPAPVPTSAVTDPTHAPPGSYGSYGYPQYPYPYPYYMPSPYGMPPYPYSHAPPPAPSETKQKSTSKSSTSTAASSSSPAQVPPSTAMPGYSPYPYPYPPPPYGYPPPPNGYPYMTTPRYVPGQQPYNGLPPGPSGPNSYPYPYFPLSAPTSYPKTTAAARERQRAQDTKFNYYHHGAGTSDSPTTPNNKKRKRRKVDSDYLEKFKAQTEAISISLAKDQTRRGTSSSIPTLPPASIASGSSNAAPPVISAQPVALAMDTAADAAPSKSITLTRACANKTCNRSLPVDTANTMCDKCRLRFKKHQAKARKRFKLEPRKSLFIGEKTISEKKEVEDEK